jgi:hypothetical protein
MALWGVLSPEYSTVVDVTDDGLSISEMTRDYAEVMASTRAKAKSAALREFRDYRPAPGENPFKGLSVKRISHDDPDAYEPY